LIVSRGIVGQSYRQTIRAGAYYAKTGAAILFRDQGWPAYLGRIRVNSLSEGIFCGKLDFTVFSAILFVTIPA
jgi:hypothetical protein